MKYRFLVVSKDILGARMSLPTAKLLAEAGHQIQCIVEGKAADIFVESSLPILYNDPGQTRIIDPHYVLDTYKPDAVIITYGSPINLEDRFALAANELNIPVIGLEDYWGCHRRTKATSNCILTIDDLGRDLAQKYFKSAYVGVVGNPAIDVNLVIDKGLEGQLQELRSKWGHVFVYVDNGPKDAALQLELLVSCLVNTSLPYCLIPRFHPKWNDVVVPDSDGMTYGKLWLSKLSVLGDRVQLVSGGRTDPISAFADITFSGASSLMTTAIYHGRQAVSLLTPETEELFLQETGTLRRSPLAVQGLIHEVMEPRAIDEVLSSPKPPPVSLLPFDAGLVVRHIDAFLE